jgi:hypothetical protein
MGVVVEPALRRKETPAEVNVHCHAIAGTVIARGEIVEQHEFSGVSSRHFSMRSARSGETGGAAMGSLHSK